MSTNHNSADTGTDTSTGEGGSGEAPHSGMVLEVERSWAPHEAQRDISESDARFRIVAAGRRFGKTELCAHEVSEFAFSNPDSLIWWVGPTYKESDIGFEMLRQIIPRGVMDGKPKLSKPQRIELVNGARIEFRSTSRDDGLVGVGLDLLVIDEAALVPERAWQQDLRPTLSDTLGRMIAISTPKGRNWFRDYFYRGQSEDSQHSEVSSWQKTTFDNPHVDDSEIEAAREELPERVFKQEYLAQFLDDTGGVFERVRERITEYDWQSYEGSPPYSIAVDFARHSDHTVIVALDSDGVLVHFDRLPTGGEVTWAQIQRRVESVARSYPGEVAADAQRDNKIVADLEAAGLSVHPVKFSGQSKTRMVQNLVTMFENGEVVIPDIPQLVTELEVFEYKTTRAGNVSYHAPDSYHDDCVDALSMAAELLSGSPEMYHLSY